MATTLKAQRLTDALKRARQVGRIEEAITVEGCPVILQNLTPEQHIDIDQEIRDLDGMEYMQAMAMANVCRAIVSVDGVDLRGVEYVEDTAPTGSFVLNAAVSDASTVQKALQALSEIGVNEVSLIPPDAEDGTRNVVFPRHEWVRDLIRNWSREAINVTNLKVLELLVESDRRARDGIKFQSENETVEDRFRKALAEAKVLEETLPKELVEKVLGDVGYAAKTQAAEFAKADERLRSVAQPPPTEATEEDAKTRATEAVKSRTPLNREPIAVAPIVAPTRRGAEIAELEASVTPPGLTEQQMAPRTSQQEVPELIRKQPTVDGLQVSQILDRPPTAGLNPRYRRPT
jgi:hypothetical protein